MSKVPPSPNKGSQSEATASGTKPRNPRSHSTSHTSSVSSDLGYRSRPDLRRYLSGRRRARPISSAAYDLHSYSTESVFTSELLMNCLGSAVRVMADCLAHPTHTRTDTLLFLQQMDDALKVAKSMAEEDKTSLLVRFEEVLGVERWVQRMTSACEELGLILLECESYSAGENEEETSPTESNNEDKKK